METQLKEKSSAAQVLIFPCPAQGHVTSMLKLAELIAMQNLQITFLNTEYIHNRIIRFNGDHFQALSQCYPKLQFKTISDCHSEENHPGIGERLDDLVASMNLYAKPLFRDIIVSQIPKISCIIIDGFMGDFATDLAAEFGIQLIHFRTIGACAFWSYFCVPKLLESKQLPFRGIVFFFSPQFNLV
jgi:hypothetical protein